jgi:hypothetical protein
MTCAAATESGWMRDISNRLPTVGSEDNMYMTWQIQGPSEIRADMRFIHLSFGLPAPATSPQAHADRRKRLLRLLQKRAIVQLARNIT